MRIINLTTKAITLTDIDRGIERDRDILESWNGKADNVIPASVSTTGYVDVLDTERVMLSTAMGQIKKHTDNAKIVTFYSITGREVGPFNIVTGVNDTFIVQVGLDAPQIITFAASTAVTMTDIVSALVSSATGFSAQESDRFFRSSNTDNVISDHLEEVEGAIGYGYGQRGVSIVSGFLVLWGSTKITLGAGLANGLLGFTTGDCTRCM